MPDAPATVARLVWSLPFTITLPNGEQNRGVLWVSASRMFDMSIDPPCDEEGPPPVPLLRARLRALPAAVEMEPPIVGPAGAGAGRSVTALVA